MTKYDLSLAMIVAVAPLAHAASSVVINISTSTSTPIAAGFSGFNVPQLRNGVEYYDPKFVAAVAPLKPGLLRFPGGTSSMAYDWDAADSTGGHIDINWMNSLITGPSPPVTGNPASVLLASQPLTQAKGGVYLSDFATFANTFQSPAVICFNGYTDTNPDSAGLMAQASHNLALKVVEWELSNEPYLFPLIFPTAATYGAAMYKPYFNDIISTTPAATTAVFFAGQYTGVVGDYSAWDNGMAVYTPHYWQAVSNHIYILPNILTESQTIQTLNGVLAHGSTDYINSYLVPLIGAKTPLYITELNCCAVDGNRFLAVLYNGIFLAEYIARLSTLPNVKGVGVNSLYTDNYDYHGIIQSVDDFESYLLAQVAANPNFSTDTATDPNTQFQFYMSAPGVALEVANQAINSAAALWPTTVTGGPMVPILGYDGNPIPAVYAQAYKGTNGSKTQHYLLITNKSSATCTTTIQVNGAHVQGTLSITTVTNPTGLVSNTAQAPNTVQLQLQTSASPITVGPYSVTTVTW